MSQIISDLHMHSIFSDGFWDVKTIILEAKKRGLKQLSITDHNVIAANKIAKIICKTENIFYVNGVEIDAKTKFGERIIHNHILVYRFDEKVMAKFLNLAMVKTRQLFLDMISELKSICEQYNNGSFNTNNYLTKLTRKVDVNKINYVTILRDEYKRKYSKKLTEQDCKDMVDHKQLPPEIISRFIKNNLFENPLHITTFEPKTWKFIVYKEFPTVFDKQYDEKYFTSHIDVMSAVEKSKGISIIAHPLLNYPEVSFEDTTYINLLTNLIKQGLNGLETYFYSNDRFSEKEQNLLNKKVQQFNEKNNLITTFGSDCHGPKNNDATKIHLGKFGSTSLIDFSGN